jgi:uncharacterized protein DUF1298
MLPTLPVEEEHPIRRLRMVHSRLDRTKSHGQRQAGNAFLSITNYIPFPVTAWAVRLLARMPQHGVVTLATNVPGPRNPLRIMGRPTAAATSRTKTRSSGRIRVAAAGDRTTLLEVPCERDLCLYKGRPRIGQSGSRHG